MTAHGAAPFQPLTAAFDGWSLAELDRRWRDYRTYRRTLAALKALEMRAREDVGFAGEDLEAVAREAVYGK